MAAGDLTTVPNAKAWLGGVEQTLDDTLLERLITAASVCAVNVMNRNILTDSYVEKYDGTGTATMMVLNYPISAISSLKVNGQAIPAQDAVPNPGYNFSGARVALSCYEFCRGKNNVEISYTAGFATVPYDIEQAVLEIVGIKYREISRIGITQQTMAGENISYFSKDIPPLAMTIFKQYARVHTV